MGTGSFGQCHFATVLWEMIDLNLSNFRSTVGSGGFLECHQNESFWILVKVNVSLIQLKSNLCCIRWCFTPVIQAHVRVVLGSISRKYKILTDLGECLSGTGYWILLNIFQLCASKWIKELSPERHPVVKFSITTKIVL